MFSMFPSKLVLLSFETQTTVCFVRPGYPGDRKDTRRLRFSFFLQRCQSAGDLRPGPSQGNTLPGVLSDRQTLAPVSSFGGGRLV
jgi:hypothetical protein